MSRSVVEAIHLPQSERLSARVIESEPGFREFQDRINVTSFLIQHRRAVINENRLKLRNDWLIIAGIQPFARASPEPQVK
jgi:hypothetical protein